MPAADWLDWIARGITGQVSCRAWTAKETARTGLARDVEKPANTIVLTMHFPIPRYLQENDAPINKHSPTNAC